MKRIALVVVTLCLLSLTILGTGVVAAQMGINGPQTDIPPVPQFDVTLQGGEVVGKLIINTNAEMFVFNGARLEPGVEYFLVSMATKRVIGSAEATTGGTVQIRGELDASVGDMTAQPEFVLSTAPPVGGTGEVATRLAITSSTARTNVGGRATLTAHLEQWNAGASAWTVCPYTPVKFMRSLPNTQPVVLGWTNLGDVRTDAYGNARLDITTPAVGYSGFKVWKMMSIGDPLAASMSSELWIQTKIGTKYFDTQPTYWVYSPDIAGVYIYHMVIVQGQILDQYNRPVSNQVVNIINWDTKELIVTVNTGSDGWFYWQKTYAPYTQLPYFGTTHAGDSTHWGAGSVACNWVPQSSPTSPY